MARKRHYGMKSMRAPEMDLGETMHSETDGMMAGGKPGFACMPQEVIMKLYPMIGGQDRENRGIRPDNVLGVDEQIRMDIRKAGELTKPWKV